MQSLTTDYILGGYVMSVNEKLEVLASTIKLWLQVSIFVLLSVLSIEREDFSANPVKQKVLARHVLEKSVNRSKKAEGYVSSAEQIAMMRQEALQNLEMAERLIK